MFYYESGDAKERQQNEIYFTAWCYGLINLKSNTRITL